MSEKTIAILGCGWLGLPLGAELVRQGHRVKGSTTRAERLQLLTQAGIEPYQLTFTPQPEGDLAGFLENVDVLIVSIPPRAGKQGDAFHPQQIAALTSYLSPLTAHRSLLYISSTSVYPDTGSEVTEADAVLENHPLVQAEELLKKTGLPLTVVRFGGLMGYDRIPGKYFIGKTVTTGEVPVNFIHRDDSVGLLSEIIRQNSFGEIFNAVAPKHPVRREIYLKNAAQYGWEPPQFELPSTPEAFKIISPAKLIKRLNYRFHFPDPLEFSYSTRQ
ncbi:MAG: NAD(P)H-binding protein [Sphingobacteriaceae bacterium]|nr:NAD(P)H-binding protein [Cytophagaceae bacterium]